MKYSEIKDMSLKELKKKKSEVLNSLFEAKIKNSLGQLSNPLEIRKMRREIAKLNTSLTTKFAKEKV